MRNIKKVKLLKSISIFFFIPVCILSSCAGKNGKGANSDSDIDSILVENRQLNSFISALSASIDSIALQEGYILDSSDRDGIKVPTRIQVMENLSLFKDLVERQRRNIEMLQDSLQDLSSASSGKIRKIISFYKKQLDEKDRMIAQLEEELDNKNADISKLSDRISSLSNDVSDLSLRNKEQEEALKVQDNIINECYVITGTKKELQKAGILSSSGIFKKKQLNVSNFNPDVFNKVDIRNFTEVVINGKKPEILTQMPADSYSLEKIDKDSYILRILDPTLFWSVSNYLVIQYN